jgi:hypothetical protein
MLLPKFDGALNDNKLDSWICIVKSYFKTQSNLKKAKNILVVEVHMEDLILTCWKTHT